jgi:hypothetical protein
MTEQRPAYQPVSHDAHQQTLLPKQSATVVPEFAPMSKPDILLLIPILRSPDAPLENPACLHLVRLDNGSLGLCNTKNTQYCPCCMHPVCKLHQSSISALFPDSLADRQALLCETCAALSQPMRYAFHNVVMHINGQVY